MTDTPRPVEDPQWPAPAAAPTPALPADARRSGIGRDVSALARAGADWVLAIATAVVAVLRWVMLISVALGVAALLSSLAAVDSGDRIGMLVVGMLLFFIPAGVAWFIHSSASTIVTKGPQLLGDMNRVVADPVVRQRLAESLRRTEDDRRKSRWTRGRRRAGDLWGLRRSIWGTRSDTLDLWGSVLALTRVPLALVVIGVGWLILAVWCAVCVLVLLIG